MDFLDRAPLHLVTMSPHSIASVIRNPCLLCQVLSFKRAGFLPLLLAVFPVLGQILAQDRCPDVWVDGSWCGVEGKELELLGEGTEELEICQVVPVWKWASLLASWLNTLMFLRRR